LKSTAIAARLRRFATHEEPDYMRFIGRFGCVLVAVAAMLVWLIGLDDAALAAGPSAQLYLSPASATVVNGKPLSIDVHVKVTGGSSNAVQANVLYPTAKLSCSSVTFGSVFNLRAQKTGNTCSDDNGELILQGGTKGSSFAGDVVLATIQFNTVATGTAAVTFASGCIVADASTTANILNSTTGGAYTIAPK
jgi:hypothetical protein